MITFKITGTRSTYRAFAELHDLVRRRDYKDAMIGPYEDFSLLDIGIIVDGGDEVALANDFEEVLKEKNFLYKRTDEVGVKFYKDRTY